MVRRSQTRVVDTSQQERSISTESTSFLWWEWTVCVLFLVRFFVPTEAVELGHTLWISTAWFALWGLRAWLKWRNLVAETVEFRWLDGTILALIAAHIASGFGVLLTYGQQRAALNLMWEWGATGVAYVCLRDVVSRQAGRRMIIQLILITGLTVAGLGIWQHFYWYPQRSHDVVEFFELQDKVKGSLATPQERQRFSQLTQEFGGDVLTLDENGKRAFLARVNESVEPLGRFALANTLGGVLAVVLVLLVSLLAEQSRGWKRWQWGVGLLVISCLMSCLLLTKSRSAVLSLMVGMLSYGMLIWLRGRVRWSVLVVSGGGLLALLAVLSVVGWSTGGLDLEVLTESAKSLSYRGEYWTATLRMLQDHPLWGIGLGNFRQQYLHYKLAGSSEEILDPHNLYLDVWANAGILGPLSLLAMLALTSVRGLQAVFQAKSCGDHSQGSEKQPQPHQDGSKFASPSGIVHGLSAGAAAILLVAGYEAFSQGDVEPVLWSLLGGWFLCALGIHVLSLTQELSRVAVLCGMWTLALHLVNSGGISMPVVQQLLFVLMLLSIESLERKFLLPSWVADSRLQMGVRAVLLLGIMWTAWIPHVLVTSLLSLGEQQLLMQHNYRAAEQYFHTATTADTLDPKPWQQVAHLNFIRWDATGRRDEELFALALAAQQEVIQRDPLSPNPYRTLGDWWLERAETSAVRESAGHAVAAFEAAAQRYPHSSAIQASLALAYQKNGQDEAALRTAQRAIELDELNRSRMHYDRLLPKPQRAQLDAIVNQRG